MGHTPQTVLLIEDEDILSNILTSKLERAGYRVAVAKDGEEGLAMVSSEHPDLVLLDMMLPKLNGFAILEQLNEQGTIPGLPVIVISNSGQPVEIERAEKLGIVDYLVKLNFDPDEVLAKVEQSLATAEASDTASAADAATATDASDVPATDAPSEDATQQQQEATEPTKKTVMIVEDDMFIADLLGRKLHEKYTVHQAGDTSAADRILTDGPVDLICLDIMLPGEDGYSYLARLKESPDYQNIPVVILSNLGQKEEVQRGLDAGATDYLVKANMAPHEIMERVDELLSSLS
ncbi:response regulator [Patescibacteria group bacterium]|jgi:DNA-binding response OmpR family regulator|nr:response regulator [Patescibacteria group bacterium]